VKKALIIIATVLFAFTATLSFAADNQDQAMIGDILILRPLGLLATAVGAIVQGIGLPVSLLGGNAKEAGDTLVVAPAKFTFVRPVGDF
jgi:diacylglycerol kinase